jgi:hypothetical protein
MLAQFAELGGHPPVELLPFPEVLGIEPLQVSQGCGDLPVHSYQLAVGGEQFG